MKRIIEDFKRDVQSVYSLLEFDHYLMEWPIKQFSDLSAYFDKNQLGLAKAKVDKALKFLQGIRQHESTKVAYSTIYNQCLVLLVSYFSATMEEIFRYCIVSSLQQGLQPDILKEEVKVSVSELCSSGETPELLIPDLLITGGGISFQDMGSIHRAFRKFLGYAPEKNEIINDIIFGQASRHIIVHSGARITRRFLNQIRDATPRHIKPKIQGQGEISFVPKEIKEMGAFMQNYTVSLTDNLKRYQLKGEPTNSPQ